MISSALRILLVLLIVPHGSARALTHEDDPAATGFSVDMGNPRSEAGYRLEGWADIANWNPLVSPSGDQSKHFMTRSADNVIFFHPVDPGRPYLLTAEVEDGLCDDSFQVLVAGELLYDFVADQSPTTLVKAHRIAIPERLVTGEELAVVFRNTARDRCGSAPVYNIAIERRSDTDVAGPE